MTEIQSTQHSTIPSWVMMDHRFRFNDPGPFRADGEASAETQDSNGDAVRISFGFQAPPKSSSFRLHCPERREPSSWDFVLASHLDAVLFRIQVNFDRLSVNHGYADYFIYRASSSSAKLTLLPPCYSRRMKHSSSIGLFADGEHFLVAELCLEDSVNTAPLEAKLFKLYSYSSPLAANGGGGQWEVTPATSRDSKVTFQDVVGWKTHRVIPFTSYLCWADYNRGVLFCDVRSMTPELKYLRFPIADMPYDHFPKFSRTLCVTNKGDTMKFVKVVRKNTSIFRNCNSGFGYTISLWTVPVRSCDENKWVEDFCITDTELQDMGLYDDGRLPGSVPQFPVMSMDDPDILYFVLRGTSFLIDEVTSWIVTLDMKSKVLSYECIKGLSDDNISCGFGFFPSNFTKYMTTH